MSIGSKGKILHVAREQFYRSGFLATSVDDIIEQAKVSKSNFYYHFKTKEDLGLAALARRCEELEAALTSSLRNSALSPRQRLAEFFRFIGDSQETRIAGGCPF